MIAQSFGPGAERLGPYIAYNQALIEHHDGNLEKAARVAHEALGDGIACAEDFEQAQTQGDNLGENPCV